MDDFTRAAVITLRQVIERQFPRGLRAGMLGSLGLIDLCKVETLPAQGPKQVAASQGGRARDRSGGSVGGIS